jgi:Sec-independent protein translocase protein TatA
VGEWALIIGSVLCAACVLAFGLPSNAELLVIMIVGLLVFGRRLPEVGRTVGKTVAQLRRSLQNFKSQLEVDEEVRELRTTVHDLRQVTAAPRVVADARHWMRQPADQQAQGSGEAQVGGGPSAALPDLPSSDSVQDAREGGS